MTVLDQLGIISGPMPSRCTGITAIWCPICGDCTCPRDPDYRYLNADLCPLHAFDSPHGGPDD